MKKQIKTLEQLKDSQIMFEKDLPPFGYVLVCIISLVVIFVIVWSIFTNKPYTIIAQGTLTNDNSTYIMSPYSGVIDAVFIEEGMVIEQGDILFTIKSTEYSIQEEQLLKNKEVYDEQIEKLKLLVKSIRDDVNYFQVTAPEDSLYYNTFENYKAKVEQNVFDGSMYQMYGYTNEQIEVELKKNQAVIAELYYTAIQTAENSIATAEQEIVNIDAQISAIRSGKAEYNVKAPDSGVVHLLNDYRSGMTIQTGSAIATITPENDDSIISAYISTSDMARINEGDKVQIAVDGLSQTVYGNIYGVVTSIDSNITFLENNDGNDKGFKIMIKPDEEYLISNSGKKVNIVNGMTVEARIIYDEETYFDYVLSKLGLKY